LTFVFDFLTGIGIMGSQLEAAELRNKLEDLSGVEIKPGQNPYEALIDVCNGHPVSSVSDSRSLLVLLCHCGKAAAKFGR
jgi:hypothetical protein